MIFPRNARRKLMVYSLMAVLFIVMSPLAEGYEVWFTYPESELPHIVNVLDPSHTYGGYDDAMAARWNLYADIFMHWSTRLIPEFRDGYNDQVGFLNDSEYDSYFSTTGGWPDSISTVKREWSDWYTSDIAYNSGSSWTTSETGSGNLFQGAALRALGLAIGLGANLNAMSVMNHYHPKRIDAHLMPDDVKYLYDTFPNKAKMVTDMGVWAYSPEYRAFTPATATPTTVSPGDTIWINGFYVGNLRNGSQSDAEVRFYLSTNTTITDTYDTYIGRMWFTSDWPGAVGGVYDDMDFTVPSTLSPGTYYVGLIVYADGVSEDSITYNNSAYLPDPITVETQHPPDAPVLNVTTTGTTVTVSWTSVADADGYTLYYAPCPYTGPGSIQSAGMGAQRSLSINLWAGAAFYMAVQSYSSAGNSDYSNIEYFIIGTSDTSPSITTGLATSVTTSSATLNGTVNPNGTSTTYYFQYGTTGVYGSTTTKKAGGSGGSNISVSESITDLSCNTTYHYRLVGVNSKGTSYGEDQTFKTSSCPVSKPTVTAGSATSVGTSSAKLNGTVNPNGASTTYYFRYGTTTNFGMTTTSTSVGSGSSNVSVSKSITGLSDNTLYYFQLVGVNSAGTSYADKLQSFVTNSNYIPPA